MTTAIKAATNRMPRAAERACVRFGLERLPLVAALGYSLSVSHQVWGSEFDGRVRPGGVCV